MKEKKKFWNWIRDESGERVLRLEGPIDEDQLWGDEITPDAFRDELNAEDGDVTLWINSPGGNVFAASQIYTMLKDYKGKVTVKIDSIAASAASVVAMAGDTVLISPTGMLMIHDPSTIAMGNTKDMELAINVLNEVKESIINAYKDKTGLSHNKIAQLMSDETWMNAKKAVELGFADSILFEVNAADDPTLAGAIEEEDEPDEKKVQKEEDPAEKPEGEKTGKETADEAGPEAHLFSSRKFDLEVLNRLREEDASAEKDKISTVKDEAKSSPTKKENQTSPVADKEPKKPETKSERTGPVMTLEGKTEDGAVPYSVLKRQLDLLK